MFKDIKTDPSGFTVTKSQRQQEREARETRIEDQRTNPKASPTLKDLYQLQLDIAARQSEIYDMLKART
jgi:hypothetical protein